MRDFTNMTLIHGTKKPSIYAFKMKEKKRFVENLIVLLKRAGSALSNDVFNFSVAKV